MTNSFFFGTTSLLNIHKPLKLKVGRVRNSGTHVLKTILRQVRVDFKLSFYKDKLDLVPFFFFIITKKQKTF